MDVTYYKCDYVHCGKVTESPELEMGWIEIRGRKGEAITFIKAEGGNNLRSSYVISSATGGYIEGGEPVVHFCCNDCLKKWLDNLPLVRSIK